MDGKTCSYLFVYGTLFDDTNPYGAFLKENSSFYCQGQMNGELYDAGNYPGAITSGRSGNFVHGAVFRLNNELVVLKELDEYEGYGDSFAQPNEFIRQMVEINTEEGVLRCWVYLFNHPVGQLSRIWSGKYF